MTTKPMHLSGVEIAAAIDAAVAAADEITPQATIANYTDNTGGATSTTLAAISDTATKNAVASLNKQINDLKAKLVTAGVLF